MIIRPLSVLSLAAASVAIPAGAAAAATTGSGIDRCVVTLHVTSTQATATVVSGCTGGGYRLVSYSAQSDQRATSYPQQLYAQADSTPYQVALPPCFQVDFTRNQPPVSVLWGGNAPTNSSESTQYAPSGSSTIGPIVSYKTKGVLVGELGGTTCTPSTPTTTVPVPITTPITVSPPTTTPWLTSERPVTSVAAPSAWAPPVAKPSADATAATGRQLATTGAPVGVLFAIGAGTVGLGSAVMGFSRRLRRARSR